MFHKIHPSTSLGTLILVALALLVFAGAANAAPPLPRMTTAVYSCDGGWERLEFQLGRVRDDYYRGTAWIGNAKDNRKAALAAKSGGFWEATFKNTVQCKELRVFYHSRKLHFAKCGDGIERVCWLR